MSSIITRRASMLTPVDVALLAQAATQAPRLLIFTEVGRASAPVRRAIQALEADGRWRPTDLPPAPGAIQPVSARIHPESVVVSTGATRA